MNDSKGLRRGLGVLLVLSMIGASGCQYGTKPSSAKANNIPGMELVWGDEFNYSGLPDPAKWGYDTGGGGWGNEEAEYYTEGRPENAKVENGHLTLTARKEDYQGASYTSSRLVSRGKGQWLYGHVEVRAKIPVAVGAWPAIWMMPAEPKYGDWPDSGEIDLMEHVGYEQGTIHATAHMEKYYWKKNNQKTAQINLPDLDQAYHVYSLDWKPGQIDVGVDGKNYFTYRPDPDDAADGYKAWPFDNPFYLILNIAVGGSWGGAQGIDEKAFPQTMEVDYVRVYQDKAKS